MKTETSRTEVKGKVISQSVQPLHLLQLMPPTIRLVSFDAFQTILTPRLPVYVQYSQTFAPFLGVLEPENIKTSFKTGMRI